MVTPVLILTGIELEARTLARALGVPRLRSFPFSVFGRPDLRVAPVGMGAVFCDARWPLLIAGMDGAVVVSAGVCGGLDPRLRSGALVIPAWVIGPSGTRHEVPAAQHRRAVSAAGGAAPPCTAPLVTTPHVVATPAAKALLHAGSGAAAVDMESALIVERAAGAGCPAVVIRAVVDGAGECLPAELAGLVTPDGRLRPGRALATLLSRPALLRDLIGLRRTTGQALAAVAAALRGW